MNAENFVKYKGNLLMRGSRAYELYHDKKDPDAMKKLDAHMKELDHAVEELKKRYPSK